MVTYCITALICYRVKVKIDVPLQNMGYLFMKRPSPRHGNAPRRVSRPRRIIYLEKHLALLNSFLPTSFKSPGQVLLHALLLCHSFSFKNDVTGVNTSLSMIVRRSKQQLALVGLIFAYPVPLTSASQRNPVTYTFI